MSHNKTAAYLSVSRWFCTAVVLLLHNLSYFKRNLAFRQGVSFFFYMNFAWIYFVFLYRFCNIFHYPVFIFALSKIFLFLYCCFCYPFRFLADLQLHDGRLMSHCRNNLLCQIFCPKSETWCIDAWMASDIFSCKHIFIDQKPYHPVHGRKFDLIIKFIKMEG